MLHRLLVVKDARTQDLLRCRPLISSVSHQVQIPCLPTVSAFLRQAVGVTHYELLVGQLPERGPRVTAGRCLLSAVTKACGYQKAGTGI